MINCAALHFVLRVILTLTLTCNRIFHSLPGSQLEVTRVVAISKVAGVLLDPSFGILEHPPLLPIHRPRRVAAPLVVEQLDGWPQHLRQGQHG